MQTRATHPKTARREAKSDKKKEERIGAQLMAEITEPTDDTATATISDPSWKPSSSHLQPTWALPFTAWVEQRHGLSDVQIHATSAEIRTSAGGYALGYGNGAVRASSHLKLPQQTAEHAAAAHGGCEQHAFNLVQRGATGRPTAAFTAEDPKRALVHALQNDLLRMSVLLEQLDELLSA